MVVQTNVLFYTECFLSWGNNKNNAMLKVKWSCVLRCINVISHLLEGPLPVWCPKQLPVLSIWLQPSLRVTKYNTGRDARDNNCMKKKGRPDWLCWRVWRSCHYFLLLRFKLLKVTSPDIFPGGSLQGILGNVDRPRKVVGRRCGWRTIKCENFTVCIFFGTAQKKAPLQPPSNNELFVFSLCCFIN